jgi:hypothetical protein
MTFNPETAVLIAFVVEVFLLIALVPAVLKVSQWEHAFRLQKDAKLLELRQLRSEVKELRYAVEAVPELYAFPFFKRWKNNPLRWILPHFLK